MLEKRAILRDSGIQIVKDQDAYAALSSRFHLPPSEIRYIDLNRTGVYLPNNEVRTGFRARILTEINTLEKRITYFALPVREKGDTSFMASESGLSFKEDILGEIFKIELDTCDTSYMRGPDKLNLNSQRRGNCRGCDFCVHNYDDLYDSSVIKDSTALNSKKQISNFFEGLEKKGVETSKLSQIAVVTGLFHSEERVVEHLQRIKEVVSTLGFEGELLYFGCEVNSPEALRSLSQLGNMTLIYAVDAFTKRNQLMNPEKTRLDLEHIRGVLGYARGLGIKTTYAYVAGIDDLETIARKAEKFMECINRFPVINVYQIQTPGQMSIIRPEAKELDYYLWARLLFEEVFRNSELKPRRWENYRSLWYDFFKGKPFHDKKSERPQHFEMREKNLFSFPAP
jgi:hypothetical protein